MIINKTLSSLDHNAIEISRTKTYSSTCGKCLGVLAVIILLSAFIYKLKAMIDKKDMFLNTSQLNDRSKLNVNSYQITLQIATFFEEPINYTNQYKYGLNVIMRQIITQSNKSIIQNLYEYKQFIRDQNRFSRIQHLKQNLNRQNFQYQSRQFQMIPCQQNTNIFCAPKQFKMNQTLEGDSSLKDKNVIYYQILVWPCDNTTNPDCKPPSPYGYGVFLRRSCRQFDVNQKNTDEIIKNCNPLVRIDLIADDGNISTKIQYKLKAINITTFEPSLIPSLIPAYLLPESLARQKHQRFWYYDNQQTISYNKMSTNRDPYYWITLSRSRYSESYERRFINIDSILAQVVGVSTAIAVIFKVLFAGYARWEADSYIVAEIERNNHYKGSFPKYLTQHVLCCMRPNRKQLEQKKQRIIQKANQNVDIINVSHKFKEIEQKFKQIEQYLTTSGNYQINSYNQQKEGSINDGEIQGYVQTAIQEQNKQQITNLNQSTQQNILNQSLHTSLID